jgi:hypothetical protein
MLETVKTALRVKGGALDVEITGLIAACKKDLAVSGIVKTNETDALISRAIVLYCKAHFGYDNPDAERFLKSYDLLKCSLVFSGEYNGRGSG